MLPLILTFICGLFFLIGLLGYRISTRKESLTKLSIACAFIVILGLITTDLIPELIEIGSWWLLIFVFIGLAILIVLDKFIPHHDHHHKENDELTKEHQGHISHISTVTILALLLHNLVEGMALYSVSANDYKSGILMCLGIGLHNLPFGFQIASSHENKSHKLLLILLVLSGFLGGLIVNICGQVDEFILGIMIALTLGMLLHIFLFELLHELYNNRKKKETLCGIIIGIVILILINII